MQRPFRSRSLGREDLGKTRSQSAKGRSLLSSCTKTKVTTCTEVPSITRGNRNCHLLQCLFSRCELLRRKKGLAAKMMSSAANSDATCDKLARPAFETRKWQLFKPSLLYDYSNFVCKGTGCGGKIPF